MRRFLPAVLLPFLFAGGCRSLRVPEGSAASRTRSEEAAVESALRQARAARADYRLSGGDLVEITVFEQPELGRRLRVSHNGTVSLPLIGEVKVGDATVPEAQAALAARLKEFLVDPQVTLHIQEYGNRKIFILGEVKKPGSFDLPAESRLTVLEAVSLAGGFTPIAAPDRTRVIRSVAGRSESLQVSVSDITKRGEKHKDIALEPNDVVFIPQSFF